MIVYPKMKSPFLFFAVFHINPLPDNKILDWSKLKQIADNILKCKMKNKCHIR